MAKVPQFERIEIDSRAALRAWLETHHVQAQSIWLVSFKKGKGPYVPYDDIVEEALCFGWIDSRTARLDEARSMLLLSPRKPKSNWSKLNKLRVEKLAEVGLMAPAGLAMVELAKATGTWDALNDVDALVEPADLQAALDATPGARENWDQFPRSARRGILEWIGAAKRYVTRQARVEQTARLASQGIKANFPAPKV
jgi:uncharacterized protein YdeI (YjbR/CyaY-like superfamily)